MKVVLLLLSFLVVLGAGHEKVPEQKGPKLVSATDVNIKSLLLP